MSHVAAPEIETTGGRYLDYLDPAPDDIVLEDIAVGLANTCRFGGFVKRYYSVAEHACLVRRLVAESGASPVQQLAALHHDSHEAYLGDVPTPLKSLIEAEYRPLANRLDDAIARAFGFDSSRFRRDDIKSADDVALRMEAQVLKDSHGLGEHWGNRRSLVLPPDWIPGLAPEVAKAVFVQAHHDAVAAC